MSAAQRVQAGLKSAATRAARKAAGLPPVYPRSARGKKAAIKAAQARVAALDEPAAGPTGPTGTQGQPGRASGYSTKWAPADPTTDPVASIRAAMDAAKRQAEEQEKQRRYQAELDRQRQAYLAAEQARLAEQERQRILAAQEAARLAEQARRAAATGTGFKPQWSADPTWKPSQTSYTAGGATPPPPPPNQPKAQAPAPKTSTLFTGPDARTMLLDALAKLEAALGEYVAESGKPTSDDVKAKFKTFQKVKALALQGGTPAESQSALRAALKMMNDMIAMVL